MEWFKKNKLQLPAPTYHSGSKYVCRTMKSAGSNITLPQSVPSQPLYLSHWSKMKEHLKMVTSSVMPSLSAPHRARLIWWHILPATSCKRDFWGARSLWIKAIVQWHTAIWWMQAWNSFFFNFCRKNGCRLMFIEGSCLILISEFYTAGCLTLQRWSHRSQWGQEHREEFRTISFGVLWDHSL